MRVAVVLGLLATACNGDARPQQTMRDAVRILCGAGNVLPDGPEFARSLDAAITNQEARRRFLDDTAVTRPWDVAADIRQVAEHEAVVPCEPLDGLVGIRAHNGIDVPDLADERGTLDASKGRIYAVGSNSLEIQGVGTFAPSDRNRVMHAIMNVPPEGLSLFAIDRSTTMQALAPILDVVGPSPLAVGVLATSGKQLRAIYLRFRVDPTDNPFAKIAVIELGRDLVLDHVPIAPGQLHDALAKDPADRIVIEPAPEVTVQRLVETAAAAGGTVFYGGNTLPRVVH